jgi:formiminoglutamase
MWTKADMSLWQGRVDPEGLRYHQLIKPVPPEGDLAGATVLLGFACDAGVQRNHGRVGASSGPDAIRRALANLSYNPVLNPVLNHDAAILDAGTIHCEGDELEAAQSALAAAINDLLRREGRPVVLGGGHEIAWGSYQGIHRFLDGNRDAVGIINFDAHFDLRNPAAGGSSGTPFRQIAEHCEQQGQPFEYLVLGINPAANTAPLFDYARQHQVRWFEDSYCHVANLHTLQQAVNEFVEPLNYLYLSICLDAFPASLAPGVSAPGVPGICPRTALLLLRHIRHACEKFNTRLLLIDIAEMNPRYDIEATTARWAARIVGELISEVGSA